MKEASFKEELGKSKAALLALESEASDEMNELITAIGQTEMLTTEGVKRLTVEDNDRKHALIGTADATQREISKLTETTRSDIESFSAKLDTLGTQAQAALDEANKMEATFQEEISAKQREFQRTLMDAKKDRIAETETYKADVYARQASIESTMDLMKTLATKVTGQIKYELGTLTLDQAKLDKNLDHTLSLERYGDRGSIAVLDTKLKQAQTNEDRLDEIKARLQNKSEVFRELVQKDFEKLNVDFDMSAVDLEAAKAHESYYVQQQQQRLKAELGETLGDLSGLSSARLRALAKASGQKIAELMRNKDLSEEERAAELAKIRKDARAHAQTIAEANGRLKLEIDTSARNLQVATDEVANSMDRINALSSAGSANGGGGGLSGAIDRIKELLQQANTRIADAPPPEEEKIQMAEKQAAEDAEPVGQKPATKALVEEGAELLGAPSPSATRGPVHAALNSLLSSINPAYFHASSLLERHGALDLTRAEPVVAAAERGSERALAEDDSLSNRLSALETRLGLVSS